MERQILNDLKVVGFVTAGVGPLIGRGLAANGATVVRVESITHIDITRTSSPFAGNKPGVNRTFSFSQAGPDSLSLTLNMKHPKAAKVSRKLIEWADVVIENWSPGVMKKWGLSYEEISSIKPDIIMVRSSQMGQTGPHRHISAAGPHLSGLAGFNALTGWPDSPPVSIGPYPDYVAPPYGITALLAALDYRKRTGKGQYIDLSQYEASIQYLMPAMLDYSVNKKVQTRKGFGCDYAAPHGVYRCQGEDKWCAIEVFTETEWEAFCKVVDRPEWTEHEKFRTLTDRKENEQELNRLIERWTMAHKPEAVMEMMQNAGVGAGVVRNMSDVVDVCPQTNHRKYFTTLDHPEMGKIQVNGLSYRLSKTPYQFKKAAPCLGEHNEYICTQILDMSDEEFMELITENALE